MSSSSASFSFRINSFAVQTRFIGIALATLVPAGVLLWSSNANANTITITGGLSFGPMPTLATGSGMVNLPSTPIGNVSVSGEAVGSPETKPGTFITNAIAVKPSGGNPQTHIVSFTERDLISFVPNVEFTTGLTSNLLSTGWNATLTTFLDPTNGVAPPNGSVSLGSFTFVPTGPTSAPPIVTNVSVPVGVPFSLQEVYSIVSPSGNPGVNNTANLTIDIMGSLAPPPPPIPEPGALALLGTGLVAIGGLLRRRR